MPFTPFHMGPGLAVKAACGRHLSLMVFGYTQVLIDLEPLVRILRGDTLLHGWTHTYLGATLIAIVAIATGRPLCQRLLDAWKPPPAPSFLARLRGPREITWPSAMTGGLAGAWSHVFLDSIMHRDMSPLAPLAGDNGLLHVVSVESLHLACVAAAVLGALVLGAVTLARARRRG